jgi:cyanate permease
MALLGAGIIAITYGLARFVLGLFMPIIGEDLGIDITTAGFIGSLPFISFIAAVIAGPRLLESLAPRNAGTLTVMLAVSGLLLIAGSPGSAVLALPVVLCGMSTGFSSPVLAEAVHSGVTPTIRGRVNAVHNAGTSIGVGLAMPISAWLLGNWRGAYVSFALLTVFAAMAAYC